MSDQTHEQSLAGGEPDTGTSLPPAFTAPTSAAAVIDQVLDVERALSVARVVERVTLICLRADLEADLHSTLKELNTLVDAQGQVLEAVDASLGDSNATRANELNRRAQEINREMLQETFSVRFRGMDSDTWEAFEKANRTADGKPKPNMVEYGNKLVAATAIAPVMTEAKFAALRKSLGSKQINTLVNAAFDACTQGGLDIPKLPSFLVDPNPALS